MSEHSADEVSELEQDLSLVSETLIHSFEIDMSVADEPFLSDLVHHGVERMVEERRLDVSDRVEAVNNLTRLMSSTALEYGSVQMAAQNEAGVWPFT